ncbi:MAG: aminotransferase class III-fold pyridoxal phosphate-dependent enzyme, partial [Candidatus Competibacterales bacterium]
AAEMSVYFQEELFKLRDIEAVTDIRGYGMMGGIDVKPDGAPGVRGTALQKQLFHHGLHVKFTGDAGIVAPAFIAERHHIDEMMDKLKGVLSEVP